MNKYAIGLDFGTNSCRSLIVNIENGREIASHVFNYPTGDAGVIIDKNDTNLARQNPADYIEGIEIIKNYGFINSINCYPGKLSQVFMNILSNAIQAIPDKGTIKITTFTDEKSKNFEGKITQR